MKIDLKWIVNDIGELGVKVNGRCFFLYKGDSIEYDGCHDNGTQMLYRIVGKREFGETCRPISWLNYKPKILPNDTLTKKITKAFCYPDKYTVEVEPDIHSTKEEIEEYKWKPLPKKTKEGEKWDTTQYLKVNSSLRKN